MTVRIRNWIRLRGIKHTFSLFAGFFVGMFLCIVFIKGPRNPFAEQLFFTEFKLEGTNLTVFIVGGDGMQNVHRRSKGLESQGCKIPKLETNGPELMQFIKKETIDCLGKSKVENWVHIDKDGKVQMREDRKQAICNLTYYDGKTDFEIIYEPPVLMEEGQKMKHDFAMVDCQLNTETWKGLLMSVAKKEDSAKRAKKNATKRVPGTDRLSVAMFGFDSMSQQHFRRKMPITVKLLEKMGSVILNGYNIVGDGTPQAFIPILTGKTELELPNTRKRFEEAKFVGDVYPFVWNNFSDAGYATLYAEDAFSIGTFTYRLKGFKERPTDHYARPFYKELERGLPWTETYCLGSEFAHKSWFRYGQEFLREYKDVDRFMVMHQGVLSHNNINTIEVEDEDFASSLMSMEKEGLLDDVVLIVMADHGHRFAEIRNTHQGQIEERLPMFSVRLPSKFRNTELGEKMQENLLANKERLTTPFDVYATFLDIMNLPKEADTEQDSSHRSLSMLRPIAVDRNCHQAGVEAHWCTCLNWQNATSTLEDMKQTKLVADGLIAVINLQLSRVQDLCSNVMLTEIISAEKLTSNNDLLKYNNVKDTDGFVPVFEGKTKMAFAHYKLKVETSPNKAIFEATMFLNALTNELEVDMTSLSHVNAYGDDPHCIIDQHFALAHFCVCHDKVRS